MAGGACILGVTLWFLNDTHGLRPAVNPSAIKDSVAEDFGVMTKVTSAAQSPSEAAEEAIEEARIFFDDAIPKFRQLGQEWVKLREKVKREHPFVEEAQEYGQQRRREAADRHAEVVDQWSEYVEPRRREFLSSAPKQRDLSYPGTVWEAFNSQEKIGSSTLGAVVKDLIFNTEYFELLGQHLAKLEQAQFGQSERSGKLASVKTPAELVGLLEEMAPVYRQAADQHLARMAPDPKFHPYLRDINSANRVWELMQIYRKSWWSDVDQISEQTQTLGAQMRGRLAQLPKSDPRVEVLSQHLHDAYTIFQNTK